MNRRGPARVPLSARRRAVRPLIVALTGGIGMGKSAVGRMLDRHGRTRGPRLPRFDADACVHALQAPGGALTGPIGAVFPGSLGPDGGVDRRALGAMVLADPAARRRLEGIVHPAVADARARFLRRHRAARAVIMDIPLLFETGGQARANLVWTVAAPAWLQARRVLGRAGMTRARLAAIRRAQVPQRRRVAGADAVIATGRPLAATRARVAALARAATLRHRPARRTVGG